jgi:hypothetical protein
VSLVGDGVVVDGGDDQLVGGNGNDVLAGDGLATADHGRRRC